jgi:hypothetical protein
VKALERAGDPPLLRRTAEGVGIGVSAGTPPRPTEWLEVAARHGAEPSARRYPHDGPVAATPWPPSAAGGHHGHVERRPPIDHERIPGGATVAKLLPWNIRQAIAKRRHASKEAHSQGSQQCG